eukprot:6210854-Pleurochrysis_carterae.AAC.2
MPTPQEKLCASVCSGCWSKLCRRSTITRRVTPTSITTRLVTPTPCKRRSHWRHRRRKYTLWWRSSRQ